jgi:dual specificity phosphatase 12
MQQVMSNLWIGDYSASQDAAELSKHGIRFVVSASTQCSSLKARVPPLNSRHPVRQQYEIISGTTVHQIAVDDTETTNIIEHFVPCSNFIAKARVQGAGVLVHCQAGMSRSATLVAAYLMKEMGLNVEQALQKIRRARSQIQPSEFFLLQLELFERCDCEWDPVKVSWSLWEGRAGS